MKLPRTGELYRRSRQALRHLENCKVCPRDCEVNRLENEQAVCKTGRQAIVGSYAPHFGEEDCLRGTNGSEINRRPTSSEIVTAKRPSPAKKACTASTSVPLDQNSNSFKYPVKSCLVSLNYSFCPCGEQWVDSAESARQNSR